MNRVLALFVFVSLSFPLYSQENYLLNPGDVLGISVWNEEELQQLDHYRQKITRIGESSKRTTMSLWSETRQSLSQAG